MEEKIQIRREAERVRQEWARLQEQLRRLLPLLPDGSSQIAAGQPPSDSPGR